jgi:uncharacterized protein YdiU (UPF0061 family)
MNPVSFEASYAQLPPVFHAPVQPAFAPAPTLIRLNHALCRELSVDAAWLESEAGVAMLAGNTLPDSAVPVAMGYAGHQFGGWSPQLGDGRAVLLGEVLDRNGLLRDFHLKGAGRTPYSRGGDGKATLGAIIREYVLSEAMFALGVPTTRALAVVATGEPVYRETPMPGAILTRVATSHVRVGTFEYVAARQDRRATNALADYVLHRHYRAAMQEPQPYRAMLDSIIARQAQLVARWMLLGFIHGVMNTDNMQIVGETIDYGPCAFMDEFHPQRVFSSVDRNGRYAWDQQPVMAKWNLTRLGDALTPVLGLTDGAALEEAKAAVATFDAHFEAAFVSGFRRKLGLMSEKDADGEFIRETLAMLAEEEIDFTLFFRRLTQVADGKYETAWGQLFNHPDRAGAWLAKWRARCGQDAADNQNRLAVMQGVNPIFIARNHRVEAAIQAGLRGDFAPFHQLVSVLARPYQEQPEFAEYEQAPREEQKVRETFCGT